MIPKVSMYHLLVHTNRDINKDKTKMRTQQYKQLNTGAKEMQQFNPGGPDHRHNIMTQP